MPDPYFSLHPVGARSKWIRFFVLAPGDVSVEESEIVSGRSSTRYTCTATTSAAMRFSCLTSESGQEVPTRLPVEGHYYSDACLASKANLAQGDAKHF